MMVLLVEDGEEMTMLDFLVDEGSLSLKKSCCDDSNRKRYISRPASRFRIYKFPKQVVPLTLLMLKIDTVGVYLLF